MRMPVSSSLSLAVAIALSLLTLTAPPALCAPVEGTLKIGIVPFYTPEKIFALYQPMVDYLNRTTSYQWELALGDNHTELGNKLLSGEISIAMLGPIPYAQARQKGPIRPLLITLNPEGETHYHAVIVTGDPAVRSLADLPGKTFAYYPRSTAAHYLPFAMLAEEGVKLPAKDLVPFTSQDRMVSALLSNEAAAGGIKDALFRKLNDPRLRVLKTSRPLPQFTFAASPSLPPQVGASFTTVLLDLQPHVKESHREVVKGWDVEISHGFSLPGKEFDQETEALLRSVAPFAKEP